MALTRQHCQLFEGDGECTLCFEAVDRGVIEHGLCFVDIGDRQQTNFKTLASLLELALNGALFSFAGLHVVVGAQHIKIGIADADNQRLLIRRKLCAGTFAQRFTALELIPSGHIENSLAQ